ncbi:Hypothetical predicted protein [Xyrichtys novacula]|uniref:Secreted protein n=1 Tax=Xyrichtys novacula TaxID=13765 RepID=A0AAV1F0G8_XYRNO|nr:Hypothetical predicted protein [Xyrichtys novacula]
MFLPLWVIGGCGLIEGLLKLMFCPNNPQVCGAPITIFTASNQIEASLIWDRKHQLFNIYDSRSDCLRCKHNTTLLYFATPFFIWLMTSSKSLITEDCELNNWSDLYQV